jgi:hypothetical protein
MSKLTSPRPEEAVLEGGIFARVWFRWVSRVTAILSGQEPLQLAEYTVARAPDPAKWKGCTIAVTDDVGGYCQAVSDGTIWRRSYDNSEIST